VLALAAGILAIAYAVMPGALDADGWRWVVLRWFHTVAWVFLGLAALVRARITGLPLEAVAPLAATAGLAYVAVMLATVASPA
jgi:hypothetical protein